MRPLLLLSVGLLAGLTGPVAARAAAEAVPPELLAALKAREPRARVKAIMALSKLGAEAVPPLVGALDDEEPEVGQAAAYGLRLLRDSPRNLVTALRPYARHKSPKVRRGVAGALAGCGAEGLPLLLPALEDPEASVRREGALSLQRVVKGAPKAVGEVVPALAGRLKDDSVPVRLAVVQTLARCGRGAVEPLLGALKDEETQVRAYAGAALAQTKPDPRAVLPALAQRLREDPEAIVRQSALRTLATLGGPAAKTLTEGLADKEPAVRKAALQALGKVGPEARTAIPAVKELARKEPNAEVRGGAVLTLAKLGPGGESALLDLLKVDDSVTRLACLQCLGRKGSAPRSAVPDLAAALADKDAGVRALAAYVLGLVGPDAREALPALNKALEDPDPKVRAVVARALKQIKSG